MAHFLAEDEELHGDRVSLRVPAREDLRFIRWLWADPETMASVGGPLRFGARRLSGWYARMIEPGSPTDLYCLIVETERRSPVGEVSFHGFDAVTRTATLNIKVAARFRGMGFARDALRVFLRLYFERVEGEALLDDVAEGNIAGQGFLLRMGFERVLAEPGGRPFRMTRKRYFRLFDPL